MILGTVEIGLDYGINNTAGKPSKKQAYDLLDAAWNAGIREVDTAIVYGNAEELIGNYHASTKKEFLIDTKMPFTSVQCDYHKIYDMSRKRLRIDSINILYLHSFEQCKSGDAINFLRQIKEDNGVNKIGVSIYEPIELEYIIDSMPFIDVVQFPFSIIDSYRWKRSGLLARAKKNGIILYARSIYLQGLIFMKPSDVFVCSIKASDYIEFIRKVAKENEVSIAEIAYEYVLGQTEIDDIIIGCHIALLNVGFILIECHNGVTIVRCK